MLLNWMKCLCRLQVLDQSGCPVLTKSPGSWWRPAGTGTPPRGRCSVSWSPACRASWSGSATAARNRRAAVWTTQTENTQDKLTVCVCVCDRDFDQKKVFLLYLWRPEQRTSVEQVTNDKHPPCSSRCCWIYIIYEEVVQTRRLQICVFYCLCSVYLYTNSTLCFCHTFHANCYLVIEL